MRTACLLLVAVAALAAAPPEASATDDSARKKAQKRLDRSAQLFRAGDYSGALAELRSAEKLTELAIVRFNVARCLEEMRQAEPALRAFEEYLGLQDTTPGAPDRRRRARETAARLEDKVFGSIGVVCGTIPDATVVVEGAIERPQPCPLQRGRVRPGRYAVRATAPGRGTVLVAVDVVAGRVAAVVAEPPEREPAKPAVVPAKPVEVAPDKPAKPDKPVKPEVSEPVPQPPPKGKEGAARRTWAWVALGTGGAAGVTAITLGLMAADARGRLDRGDYKDQAEGDALYNQAKDLPPYAWGLGAVGAVGIGAGVWLMLRTNGGAAAPEATVVPVLSRGVAGVALVTRF